MSGLLRFGLIVGLVLSAVLGTVWILGLVSDADSQVALQRLWAVVCLFTGLLLGVFLVGKTGSGKGNESKLDRYDQKNKQGE